MSDLLSRVSGSSTASSSSVVKKALETMREHLGMDAAYVSQFVERETVFQEVDAPGLSHLLAVGDRHSLDAVYCEHILAGRLPELILDTGTEPIAAALPITHLAPIGAHVSVPIRRADGTVYGMFCCLSAKPKPSLNPRDLHIFKAFAGLVSEEIDRDLVTREQLEATKRLIQNVLHVRQPAIALQPIVSIAGSVVTGYEALARFQCEPMRSPDQWFADAAEVGMAIDLECLAIRIALQSLDWLPGEASLSINISPATAVSDELADALRTVPLHRIVLELTEHSVVADYAGLRGALARYRARGARLAIDDAGAGFSGLQHILKMEPDSIKLDMSLTRGIDVDPARQALAAAMLMFAQRTGAVLVAEGIETEAELAALQRLGVTRGQGYLLGKPRMATDLRAEALQRAHPLRLAS